MTTETLRRLLALALAVDSGDAATWDKLEASIGGGPEVGLLRSALLRSTTRPAADELRAWLGTLAPADLTEACSIAYLGVDGSRSLDEIERSIRGAWPTTAQRIEGLMKLVDLSAALALGMKRAGIHPADAGQTEEP